MWLVVKKKGIWELDNKKKGIWEINNNETVNQAKLLEHRQGVKKRFFKHHDNDKRHWYATTRHASKRKIRTKVTKTKQKKKQRSQNSETNQATRLDTHTPTHTGALPDSDNRWAAADGIQTQRSGAESARPAWTRTAFRTRCTWALRTGCVFVCLFSLLSPCFSFLFFIFLSFSFLRLSSSFFL